MPTQEEVQNFINDLMNVYLDTDGFPSYNKFQCVDLVRAYLAGGIKGNATLASKYSKGLIKCPLVGGNAIDYWYGYDNNATLKKYFTKIPNSWTFVPKLGDVGVFAGTNKNPYGHICLCTNAGNVVWFTVFEQNDPIGSPCHYKAYNYISPKFLGVLRPKL